MHILEMFSYILTNRMVLAMIKNGPTDYNTIEVEELIRWKKVQKLETNFRDISKIEIAVDILFQTAIFIAPPNNESPLHWKMVNAFIGVKCQLDYDLENRFEKNLARERYWPILSKTLGLLCWLRGSKLLSSYTQQQLFDLFISQETQPLESYCRNYPSSPKVILSDRSGWI